MKTYRLLIVEDEPIVAMDLEERLTSMGYRLAGRAATGEQALALAREQNPDLVLMDIRIQGEMDGIATAAEIRRLLRIPVIFLTAYAEDDTLARAKVAEPYGYLLKPFDPRELKSTIEIALYKHATEAEILHLNRLYNVLSHVNQAIVRCQSKEELFQDVCRVLVNRGEIDLAWIGWLDPDTSRILPVAQFGSNTKYLDIASFYADPRPEGQGNPGQAIQEGKPFICNECDSRLCLYPAAHAPVQFGFHSCASFPLRLRGGVCGTLSLCVAEPGFFCEREMDLLKEVVSDISFALDKFENERERLQGQASLHASEERFRAYVEQAADPIFAHDASGKFQDVNQQACRSLGYTREELLQMSVLDIEQGLTLAKLQNVWSQIQPGHPLLLEGCHRHKEGSQFPVEISLGCFALRGERQFLCQVRNIFERQQAELALKESANRQKAILDNIPDPAWLKDPEGHFLAVNKAWCKFFGCTSPDIVGKLDLDVLSAAVAKSFHEQDRAVMADGCVFIKEELVPNNQGHAVWFETYKAPLTDGAGQIQGTIGIARNIHERKQREHLERLQRDLGLSLAIAQTPEEILRICLHGALQTSDMDAGAVYLKDVATGDLHIVAHAGLSPDFIANVTHCAADSLSTHLAETGHPIYTEYADLSVPKGQAEQKEGLRAIAILPIRLQDQIIGCINIASHTRSEIPAPARAAIEVIAVLIGSAVARARSELQLRQSEQRLRDIISTMADWVWEVNAEGHYTYVSEHVKHLLGYEINEILGRTPFDFMPTEEAERVGKIFQAIAARKEPFFDLDNVCRHRDGSIRNLLTSGVPLLDKDGRLMGYRGTDKDITLRKCAEAQLRKLSRAIEQSPVSIVITDLNGAIEYVNPKFVQVTGYSLDEVRDKNINVLKGTQTNAETYHHLWQTITAGKEWFGEFHNRKKNGELYWESASVSPIFDATGQTTHFLAIKEDVTKRKQLETQLQQAQKMEAIGQLAGGVAHDFNNILAAIMMNLDLLQDFVSRDAENLKILEELQVEARRAADLTRQLLIFGRRSILETKALNLDDVVVNVLKMLRRLIGEHIDLQILKSAILPSVEADTGMVEQVLMNLVVNARDAMPKGGRITFATEPVKITEEHARANPDRRPGLFVCLSVTDTGCGMDDATQRRIFEPFFTTKEPGKGTGLGLATVYGIVAQHKGWIEVKSQMGLGSTFKVFFPETTKTLTGGGETATQSVNRPGHETILLVEDEPNVRLSADQVLRKLGYHVLVANHGQEAISLWQKHHTQIDLLFTDMVMPEGITGLELAEKLRIEKPDLKVIISSGYSTEMTQLGKLTIGGIIYLPKPYDSNTLNKALHNLLDQKSP
jgi:PAS domain S-box-containing protein